MNFPLPSGSSPALKPPGNMMIWESWIPFTIAWIVSSIACAVRLRMIKILLSAPARSKARAVSYSQFCPGKTGINTFGLAMFTGAVKGSSLLYNGCSSKSSGVSDSGALAGKMGSSVSVYAFTSSSFVSVISLTVISALSVTVPSGRQSSSPNSASRSASFATSSNMPPGCRVNRLSVCGNGFTKRKPNALPNVILVIPAAMPPSSTAAAALIFPSRTS